MNKTPVNKGKIALFVLGATVANLALMIVCFVLLMALYSALLSKILPAEALVWAIAVAFLLALVISTLVYRRLLKFLRARYHLDEYLGLGKK
jgi:membrane protein YdbS with pleckstrin-like domain